ncbi:hypothetical protein [Xanthobacter tagetidis]|uniref:Uncharacterized protein n=1 Tax=Xanthobacter tagetidis TaxID=60216 RepID=A0A3L7AH17_9HYPH|nr:hypothetical protein [Xanthobacter tagetidis]MBB6308513.1 hypothetical protein [Xanthobacter tagetidis]RLP78712.1 hypothetical protein D9R14_10670 [Xanthobacter tagetidis]
MLLAHLAGAGAVAILALGMLAAPARAGCSLDDLWNATKDTFQNAPTECAAQLSNPAFYALTAFLAGAIQTPEGKSFCSGVSGLKEDFKDDQEKLSNYWSYLPQSLQNTLQAELPYFSKLSESAADANLALATMDCACSVVTWDGPDAVAGEIGECFKGALCELQDLAHDLLPDEFPSCTGTPPAPPQLVDCRLDPSSDDPNSAFELWNQGTGWVGDVGMCNERYYAGPMKGEFVAGFTCEGDVCYSDGLLRSGSGTYCYCPAAMQQMSWYNLGDGDCYRYLHCACPAGTTAVGGAGGAGYMCTCNDTGLPVNADGTCPKPCNCDCPNNLVLVSKDTKSCTCTCGCPQGQTRVGDTCVTPCADPSQLMLEGGTCCAATQATACGTCCPFGMKPDANGQSCVSVLGKPGAPKLPPKGPLLPPKLPKQMPKGL